MYHYCIFEECIYIIRNVWEEILVHFTIFSCTCYAILRNNTTVLKQKDVEWSTNGQIS